MGLVTGLSLGKDAFTKPLKKVKMIKKMVNFLIKLDENTHLKS